MSNVPQIVVVGAGGAIGSAHLEALLRAPQFNDGFLNGFQIGFCSSNPVVRAGRLNQGNNLGVNVRPSIEPALLAELEVYGSIDAVLENRNVSGVVICTPTSMHVDHVGRFNQAGITTLVEKPYGFDPDDITEMRRTGKSPTFRTVGHILPFFPAYVTLTGLLKGDACGSVESVEMTRHVRNSNDINKPANRHLCRSAFFDLVVHDIHYALYQFGVPEKVVVVGRTVHPQDANFLSQAKVKLIYSWGEVVIDAGAFPDDRMDFCHSYSVRMDTGYAFMMSPEGTNWHALAVAPDGPPEMLPVVPASYTNWAPDIAPFCAEHELFLTLITESSTEPGPLDEDLAHQAVQIAVTLEKMALNGTPLSWTPVKVPMISIC